ncbi:MAG: 4Fe-4S cluster-binding domain-containing protein [Myxococcota bacterium]|nr:4Fe-4S cluster-binding domain-containing protein [Myxococcota bacterium]
MCNKEKHIERTKAYVGWVYRDLKWFAEEEAHRAHELRECLWTSLVQGGAQSLNRDTKISTGNLSRGCAICGKGKWSCLVVGIQCNAACFFCPRAQLGTIKTPLMAGGISFDDEDDYVAYLEMLGFEGASFSGGEPTLALDRVVSLLKRFRRDFSSHFYVWMYTNGIGLKVETLRLLKGAGLNEIRFNIVPTDYSLSAVEMARQHIDVVTVEVPVVPEQAHILRNCLPRLSDIGVDHLNLHQLHATRENYRNLMDRDYTFLHYPSQYPVPIFESEIAALRLIENALDRNLRLPINYCSQVFKYRFQNAAARGHAAHIGLEQFETKTELGYIRRLTISQPAESRRMLIEALEKEDISVDMWPEEGTDVGVAIHHSLLKFIRDAPSKITIRYFEVPRISRPQERVLVAQFTISITNGAPLERFFSQGRTDDDNGHGIDTNKPIQSYRELLGKLHQWEFIPSGPGLIC